MNKIKNAFLCFMLIYFVSYDDSLGKDYYFTDTFGNEINYIYKNVNNYFSIKTRDNSPLNVSFITCSKSCYYNGKINELKVNPTYTDRLYIYIVLDQEKERYDTISIEVVEPFPNFKINILSDSSNALQVAYNQNVIFDLYFDKSYNYITKFEENIFFIPYIYDENLKYYLVIRKISYYRYELLLPIEVFTKNRIAYLKIIPYITQENTLLPILHREAIIKIKIEELKY